MICFMIMNGIVLNRKARYVKDTIFYRLHITEAQNEETKSAFTDVMLKCALHFQTAPICPSKTREDICKCKKKSYQ